MPRNPTTFFTRLTPSLEAIVIAFVVVVGLALAGIEVSRTLDERTKAIADSKINTANLVKALDHQAWETFRAADTVLSGVVERLETDGTDPARMPRLRGAMIKLAASLPMVQGLYVHDATGRLLATSLKDMPAPYRIDDSEYFLFHSTHTDRDARISRPVRSRSTGLWVIPVAKRYNKPDGSFAGVVLASVDMAYFEKYYATFDIGQHGSITLFEDTGNTILRRPFMEAAINANLASAPLFTDYLPYAPSGDFTLVSRIDGIERFSSYRRVEKFPLVVAAALSRDEVLAPWYKAAWHRLAADLLMLAIVALLGGYMVYHAKRAARAERMVTRMAREYRVMADSSSDMIFRLDLNLVRRYVSPACQELLGYTPEEMLGTQPLEMIHPDDAPSVSATFRAMIAGQDRGSVTNRIRHRDGHWVWVEGRLRLVRDDAGKPHEILGSLRDITSRKMAELEAEAAAIQVGEANELLRRAEKMAQIGHWHLDLRSGEVVWSEEVYRIYGHAADFTPSLDAGLAAYHPDDREIIAADIQAAIDRGEPFSANLRLIRQNGDLRHVLVHGECDTDAAGNVTTITGTFQDVTERKNAEDERWRSEARLAHILAAAELATWRLDFVAGTWAVNDKYLELAGLTRETFDPDLDARWDLVHPDDAEPNRQAFIDHVANRQGLYEVEMRLRQQDGGWRWVQSRGAIVEWDPAGKPVTASGILVDIDERRRMMDDLAAARDAADTANRAKSDFLAAMSHEIRTPMSGVIGFADFLLDSELNEQQRRYATLLKDAGKSLLVVINDILDFSKIEAGKLELERIAMSLGGTADEAISILRPSAMEKGLDITLNLAPDLPAWVLGDPTRLRQILFNLLNNAIKFTETGGITLAVSREPHASGDMARFTVRDTGIGIPFDKQDRLFQTFSQVEHSTNRRFGGTGLGLVICKRLADAMGGTIGVVSTPGKGSTFWFTVALLPAEAPEELRREAKPARAQPARILVAEDVLINQVIVEELLRQQAHDVVIVGNGAEAVEAVQHSHFDLVLMDLQMPGMDGIEATRIIRGLDDDVCDIPIIALTANALDNEVTACRAAGMNGHVSKPIDFDALLDVIDNWVGRR